MYYYYYYNNHFYHHLSSLSSCILLFNLAFVKLYPNDENYYSVCRSMAIIIYEPLPLISLCVLFRKAATTGFAIINCRFKTLERCMVDFIGYCLHREVRFEQSQNLVLSLASRPVCLPQVKVDERQCVDFEQFDVYNLRQKFRK
jgi:hypothetical protein